MTIYEDTELIEDVIEEMCSTAELIRIFMPDVDYIIPIGAAEGDQELHAADSEAVSTSEGQNISATDQQHDVFVPLEHIT